MPSVMAGGDIAAIQPQAGLRNKDIAPVRERQQLRQRLERNLWRQLRHEECVHCTVVLALLHYT